MPKKFFTVPQHGMQNIPHEVLKIKTIGNYSSLPIPIELWINQILLYLSSPTIYFNLATEVLMNSELHWRSPCCTNISVFSESNNFNLFY